MTDPDPELEPDRPTIAPFLGALAIIILVVIGILVVNGLGEDGPTPDQEVARAAVAQNDALQRADYQDFRLYTCPQQQVKEADLLVQQRDSVEKHGERYIDGVTNVRIDGDRATATVVYHFDNAPDDAVSTESTFVRTDGAWKVCSPGPR